MKYYVVFNSKTEKGRPFINQHKAYIKIINHVFAYLEDILKQH